MTVLQAKGRLAIPASAGQPRAAASGRVYRQGLEISGRLTIILGKPVTIRNRRLELRISRFLLLAVLLVGCGASVGATPIIIYVTPPPDGPQSPGSSTSPLATNTSVLPSVGSAIGTGSWQVDPIKKDAITDEQTASATLSLGGGTGLGIVCATGARTALAVLWDSFLGSQEFPIVEIRIGSSPPESKAWSTEASTSFTFYPGGSEPNIAFIESMFGQTQLVARLTKPRGGTETLTFDITGIENAVANVRTACVW